MVFSEVSEIQILTESLSLLAPSSFLQEKSNDGVWGTNIHFIGLINTSQDFLGTR